MHRATVFALFLMMLVLFPTDVVLPADNNAPGPNQPGVVQAVLNDEVLRQAKVSVKLISLRSGKTIFKKNENLLLIPASTNKIVSGAAALDSLGPGYRFATGVFYTGALSADGTLSGNLYLKGGGDPSLSLEQSWLLAHQIRAHGIRKVEGALVGDATFFDDVRHYSEWGAVGTRAYLAPMGALSVNFNTLGVYVAPGLAHGDRAHATLNPQTGLYQLENRLTTVSTGRNRVAMSLEANRCVVSGQVRIGSTPNSYYRSINSPLPYALAAFRSFLVSEGVTIAKESMAGTVPENATSLLVFESKPLSLIIRDLYRSSNNFTAEQTARTLGATVLAEKGTQQSASKAIVDWLSKQGLYDPGMVVNDASGLSRLNRISANRLVDILTYMWNKPEVAPEFVEAMAIGGVDGTLKKRFLGTGLEKRVRAKSGLLWGVITLAGYCWDSSGEPYAFAVMINQYDPKASVRTVHALVEKLLNALVD